MSIMDSYNERVTFDTWDGLEDKMDRLTVMMGKLTSNNGTNRQFKTHIYQSKRREQSRNFYVDIIMYDKGHYQNRYRSNSGDRKIQFSGQSRGKPRYEQNYRN